MPMCRYIPSYCGPPPPSGGTQSMIWYGSMMSHVLQWTQFDALICSFLRAVAGVHHLVDVRRTEARARIAVLLAAARAADVGVVDDQVRRLILGVPRARVVHVGQPVERELAIDLRRVDRRLGIGPARPCSSRPASAMRS